MNTARIGFALLGGVLLAAGGCGGSDGNGGGVEDSSAQGAVALYLTDNLADYRSVVATLNGAALVHTGSGERCDLLPDPLSFDIVELGTEKLLDLVNIGNCPARPYNRVRLDLGQQVELTDINGITQQCDFRSYKDQANRPNILFCANGECGLDINGAVNVLAGGRHDLTLDFDLKEFEVSTDAMGCAVTLKVSPIRAADKTQAQYLKSIVGRIGDLDLAAQRFVIVRGNTPYQVDFSAVTQPGIATLLERAADDGLVTRVRCTVFDAATATCTAVGDGAITVNVEGTASGVDLGLKVLTLTYQAGKTLDIDYSGAARVDGAPTDGGTVEAQLTGHDGTRFLAARLKAE
jgi:hypothetical protein